MCRSACSGSSQWLQPGCTATAIWTKPSRTTWADSRYDQREDHEEEEANAIGTEYVRVDLMPSQQASRAQSLLRQYLDERVRWCSERDPGELAEIDAETTTMQQTNILLSLKDSLH